ncbi:hypothetical protein OG249_00070 [Streptomyces microflavus]|uniref:hypothetical protein n=1 Tax=Streptomyces microflavus TaxID=1919 RepID=UPI00224E469D|nr:hypothetical protein [Streptomyces microflavus]MCX4650304.1 hypothetical protein [Streptomyces microflavus]
MTSLSASRDRTWDAGQVHASVDFPAPAAGEQPAVRALEKRGDRCPVRRWWLEGRGERDGEDVAQVDGVGGDVGGAYLVGDGGFLQPDRHGCLGRGETGLQ